MATFAESIGGVKAALNQAERCYLNRFEQDFRFIICGSGTGGERLRNGRSACISTIRRLSWSGKIIGRESVSGCYTPTNSCWLNRIEAQFTALRHFTLDGTDHASHKEQASMIRRYIIWRNNHAYDERLRRIVGRANTA